MSLHELVSADGTRIGWEQKGSGPMLVLVHGATADRNRWAAVERQLAQHYTLVLMDRRGRGLSRAEGAGEYRIAAEADDVRAVVAAAAQAQAAPVLLFGHSYGALCALDAALDNPQIEKLLVYEPAFATPGMDVIGPDALAELAVLIGDGAHERALEYFFIRVIGVPDAMVAMMKTLPSWQQRLEAVPTLTREGAAANAWVPSRIAELTMPLRILVGEVSPPWLRAASQAAHAAAPASSLVELSGQAHGAMDTAPQMFIDEVRRFL